MCWSNDGKNDGEIMHITIVQNLIDIIRNKNKGEKKEFVNKQEFIPKKVRSNRILLVYTRNFLNLDAGNNAYCYEIIKILKNLGYSIDFMSTTSTAPENDFDNFYDRNKEEGYLIENLYLSTNHKKNKPKNHSKFSIVSDEMVDIYNNLVSNNNYDYIFIYYVNFLDIITLSKYKLEAKVILALTDFQSLQIFYDKKNRGQNPLIGLGSFIQDELGLLSKCDEVICISNDEKFFFQRFYGNKPFYFLPYFTEIELKSNNSKDIDSLFVGSRNNHNINSILWFFDKVYPLLNQNISITVCGKVSQELKNQHFEKYQKMINSGINFIDYAKDLSLLYARAKIAIVPMVSGTGLKTKTITAMAYGVPVVTNELGVDGFPDKFENGCLVTNNPVKFAEYITELLQDRNFYSEICKKEKSYYDKYLSYQRAVEILSKIFQKEEF